MNNRAFDKSKYPDWIAPDRVTPYARNAKIHTEKQIENIANSIRRFGWQQDTVLFETLFKATGTESTNREVARRNREFCFDVLDYWKAAGYIKGYSQQVRGRSITGVIIEH